MVCWACSFLERFLSPSVCPDLDSGGAHRAGVCRMAPGLNPWVQLGRSAQRWGCGRHSQCGGPWWARASRLACGSITPSLYLTSAWEASAQDRSQLCTSHLQPLQAPGWTTAIGDAAVCGSLSPLSLPRLLTHVRATVGKSFSFPLIHSFPLFQRNFMDCCVSPWVIICHCRWPSRVIPNRVLWVLEVVGWMDGLAKVGALGCLNKLLVDQNQARYLFLGLICFSSLYLLQPAGISSSRQPGGWARLDWTCASSPPGLPALHSARITPPHPRLAAKATSDRLQSPRRSDLLEAMGSLVPPREPSTCSPPHPRARQSRQAV